MQAIKRRHAPNLAVVAHMLKSYPNTTKEMTQNERLRNVSPVTIAIADEAIRRFN